MSPSHFASRGAEPPRPALRCSATCRATEGRRVLAQARDALEAAEKRAKEREAELERRIAQFASDLQREEALIADAAAMAEPPSD